MTADTQRAARRAHRTRIGVATAVVIVSALAYAVVFGGNQPRGARASGHVGRAVIELEAFRTLGGVQDPWSGAGLAQQIRDALASDRDVVVILGPNTSQAVGFRLRGTISRERSQVSVGVQLLRLPSDSVLWTGAYWRSETDLRSLPDDVAEAVLTVVRRNGDRAGAGR